MSSSGSTVHQNEHVETVSVAERNSESGLFVVIVTLKSGTQTTRHLTGGDLLVKYGAYLTAEDRLLISAPAPANIPTKQQNWDAKKDKHHQRQQWRCSIM